METTIYNPASLAKEALIQNFVVRTKVFEKIFEDIKKAVMKYPEQHYLIQGQRGMGKTTLLLRLKYEVENTPSLNNWLIPIFFNEESYDLTSLSNLWEKLIKSLDDYYHTEGKYYDYTESFVDEPDYERKCFDYLIELLHEKKNKLVVFFDNFGQLFLDNLKKKEKQRFREILMSCNDIRLIGASAVVLNDLHDYSEPFYEFFKIIPLEGLNTNETLELFSSLKEKLDAKIDISKHRAKIETLTVLTGGVIRTLMLMYEVLVADEDGTALKDLEIILDKITPLYKHRIEDLPVQQRKIIDVIAKHWDAISTKEIASSIREDGKQLSTKLISAQLQQLERNNVIEKKQTNTKNHLYQLKERFFNIWYLMRHGDRKDKRKVKWLTKFLELWYDNEADLEGFLIRYIACLKSGKYHAQSALLLSEALINSDKLDIMRLDSLVNETVAVLNEEQAKYLPSIDGRKRIVAFSHYEKLEYQQVITILESILVKKDQDYLILSYCYYMLNDNSLAKSCLDEIEYSENNILMLGQINGYLMIGEPYIALERSNQFKGEKTGVFYFIIGNLYSLIGEEAKAIAEYSKAVELNHEESFRILIDLLSKKKQFEKIEEYFKKDNHINPDFIYIALEFYTLYDNREGAKKKANKLLENITDEEFLKNPDLLVIKTVLGCLDENISNAIININTITELEKAKKIYFKIGYKTSVYNLMINLLCQFYINQKHDKKAALKLFTDINENDSLSLQLYKTFVSVWNSDYNGLTEKLPNYYSRVHLYENEYLQERFNQLILLLLSRKQYHTVLELFNKIENLKEILKPTYYALMTFLKKEFPNEIIKMGKELEQPVKEILQKIEEMKKDYK